MFLSANTTISLARLAFAANNAFGLVTHTLQFADELNRRGEELKNDRGIKNPELIARRNVVNRNRVSAIPNTREDKKRICSSR
jgi:hypothetical protein